MPEVKYNNQPTKTAKLSFSIMYTKDKEITQNLLSRSAAVGISWINPVILAGAVIMAWAMLQTVTAQETADEDPPPNRGSETEEDAEKPFPQRYAYRQKGLLALDDGIYETADRFFLKYREATDFKEPDFTDATVLLLRTRLRQGKTTEARQALIYHTAHSPGVKASDYAEPLEYWRLALLFAEEKNQAVIRAADAFIRTAEAPDLKAKAMFLKGNAFIKRQEWDKAVAAFRRLIADYPLADQAGEARFQIVYAYLAGDKPRQAGQMLEAIANRIESEDETATLRLQIYQALQNVREGQVTEALKIFREIEDKQPPGADRDWWMLLSQLVSAGLETEKYDLAAELAPLAETAALDKGGKIKMRLYQVQALMRKEQIDQAVEAIQGFKKVYPESRKAVEVEFQLAQVLRESEKFVQAAQHFGNIAERKDVAPQELRYRAYLNQGWSLMQADKPEKAVTSFAAAARLGGENSQKAEALFLAGNAAADADDYGAAAMYYQNLADNYPQTEFVEEARFRQAQARSRAGLFSDAAIIYAQFLKNYPDSQFRAEALLQRGIALKKAGNYKDAVTAFKSFTEAFPDNPAIPRALLEGFAAAKAHGDVKLALEFLATLISEHQKSDLYVQALYQRIHYEFLQGHNEQALADVKVFLDKYSRLPLSADVYIWTGGHYANQKDFETAEEYYLQAAATHPDTSQAQIALFEAARCAKRQENSNQAIKLLEQLTSDYEADALPDIHARALILYGDILAEKGQFDKARESFRLAETTAQASKLKLGATGRVGDMYYSLANEAQAVEKRQEILKKAIAEYSKIVESIPPSSPLSDKSRYRLAKCYEKAENIEKAIDTYLDVFYGHEIALQQETANDWHYFTRSGYDAARLMILQPTTPSRENLKNAARIYERIAASGVPTATDAETRALELRRKLAQPPTE
ncbi:MAG: tetratricopeptide repeat protein [Lentisphaeria bacterium]